VRQADRDRYLATLFAPAQHRDALFSLYAFNVEISQVRDRAHAPMPGEIRLQWWREVLLGEREGEAAAHPVAAALTDTLRRYGFVAAPLFELIDAHTFDLYDAPMASVGELELFGIQNAVARCLRWPREFSLKALRCRRRLRWTPAPQAPSLKFWPTSAVTRRGGSFMCRWM